MTVGELIKELKKFNPDAKVRIVQNHVALPKFAIYEYGNSRNNTKKDCKVVYFSGLENDD